MLMILARLVRSESFWAVAKVRSPHTGPEPGYLSPGLDTSTPNLDTNSTPTRHLDTPCQLDQLDTPRHPSTPLDTI